MFGELQMKVTSDFALQSLHARLASIQDFAHNFRELEDRKGAAVVIPTFNLSAAADFDGQVKSLRILQNTGNISENDSLLREIRNTLDIFF